MRLTESQIRKIIRDEVRKGKRLNESAPQGALEALSNALFAFMDKGGSTDTLSKNAQAFIPGSDNSLNTAFNNFMNAGGSKDELLDNVYGFIEDWTHGDEADRYDDEGGPFTNY